jgi:mannose-6-phosphate isomerase-like protein (cupin superfamily)
LARDYLRGRPSLMRVFVLIDGRRGVMDSDEATYDFRAEPGGALGSQAHPRGSIECLSVLEGELEVEVGEVVEVARAGETLRYRADRPHRIRNLGPAAAHATMVCILKAAVMD